MMAPGRSLLLLALLATLLAVTAPFTTARYACPDGAEPCGDGVDPCATVRCAANYTCLPAPCGCEAQCVPDEKLGAVPAPTDDPVAVPLMMTSTSFVQRSEPAAAPVCADGTPVVNCLVDPCTGKSCAEGEVCLSSYCGGCIATCVIPPQDAPPATPTATATATAADAPGDLSPKGCNKPLVKCLVDPCQDVKCRPGQVCETDYCGGCRAKCVDGPEDKAPCPYNPCKRVHCEPSAYKTVCLKDSDSCAFKCTALPPPACKPGYGFDAEAKRCARCKAGFVSDNGSNVCAACAADHYAKGNACEPCRPGFTTDGKVGQTHCERVQMKKMPQP